MKNSLFVLTFLLFAASARAQLDPRDSIIIETKSVARNLTGSPAFSVRVFITNKDSLSYMVLCLRTLTISGGGYALLNRNATGQLTFASIVNTLGPFGQFYNTAAVGYYDDINPDAFLVAGGSDGTPEMAEPPNAVRKPVWELKFRHSSNSLGQVLLYDIPNVAYPFLNNFVNIQTTGIPVNGNAGSYFTNTQPRDIKPNVLSGVLTVVEPQKGDLNGDITLSAADIVWGIKAAFGASPPAGGSASDLNCDGEVSLADVMLLLNAAFLQEPFPC